MSKFWYSIIFCGFSYIAITHAAVDITTYFEPNRNFVDNPLTITEIEDFYDKWFAEKQGQIDNMELYSILPADDNYNVEFRRLDNKEIFTHHINKQSPQSLISSAMLNDELNQYEGDLSIFSGRDFYAHPLTADDIKGFYNYSGQSDHTLITDIADEGVMFRVTFVQKNNEAMQAVKTIDKHDPKSLLNAADPVSGRIVEYYPDYANRDFNLWPLTVDEVDDFFKKYRRLSSHNIRGNYVGAKYNKEKDAIYIQFKGALSQQIFTRKIDPKNPNTMLKSQ
ncbi:MAG: hypothetical protein ACK5LE_01740 [Alphaproteobacteria bacterium]